MTDVSSTVAKADRAFLTQRVRLIPGWLGDYAALRSMELMRWQTARSLEGPAFEIGVYAGRYFAVLMREALAAGEDIVGLDTFDRIDQPSVRVHLNLPFETPSVRFLQGRSVDYDAARLSSLLAARPRFISIDGSHLLQDVRHDLALCNAVLADHGIVACDDFLNPVRLGVGQAVHEFLARGESLVPFAHIQNKLFLCRPHLHTSLFDLMLDLCAADDREQAGIVFAQQAARDASRNRSTLYGWDVVVAP